MPAPDVSIPPHPLPLRIDARTKPKHAEHWDGFRRSARSRTITLRIFLS
jgi:hypothetical protein